MSAPTHGIPVGTPAGRTRIGSRAWLVLELIVLAGLLLFAARLRWLHADHYTGSFDEGIRMQQLLLMELGFRPFRDIFASQGPLLLDLLYPLYLLFGGTLAAARLGVGLLSLIGLVGAWWAGRSFHPLAGLLAALVLALSPGYQEASRLALAEVPSLAPAIWAVACALRWWRGGAAAWLCAGLLLAALAVLIKPMALAIGLPILALTLLRRPLRWRPVVAAIGLAALLGGLVLLALDAARVFEVLGSYRLGAQRAAGSAASANLVLVRKVLSADQLGLPLLALGGVALGLLRWPGATLALATWPIAQLGLFLLYTDLADKHVVYLVPPLALLGGLVGAELPRWLGRAWQRRTGQALVAGLAGVLVIGVYLVKLPEVLRADQAQLNDADERARRDFAGTQEQARLMAALAGPGDFVLTDHPLAAYLARRPVPPWLVDTSGTRIDAGSLTSELAIREAARYRPVVVVTWRRRLGKLDGFNRWLADGYRQITTYPGSDPLAPLQVYVRADLEAQARAVLASR